MLQAPEPEVSTEDEQAAHSAHEEMHRTLSGRYKNPAIDNMQPFGVESRPAQPLASHERCARPLFSLAVHPQTFNLSCQVAPPRCKF